jgi:hypothetical protein
MAGKINIEQDIITYLFLQLLSFVIVNIAFLAIPSNPLVTAITRSTAWHLRGHAHSVQCKKVKRFKKPVKANQEEDKKTSKMRTYLLPSFFLPTTLVVALSLLRHFWCPYDKDPRLLALGGEQQTAWGFAASPI